MKGTEVTRWRYQGECIECKQPTDWTCQECAMWSSAKRVWLCSNKDCRKKHAAFCGTYMAAN